jgi:hypothetical protein
MAWPVPWPVRASGVRVGRRVGRGVPAVTADACAVCAVLAPWWLWLVRATQSPGHAHGPGRVLGSRSPYRPMTYVSVRCLGDR